MDNYTPIHGAELIDLRDSEDVESECVVGCTAYDTDDPDMALEFEAEEHGYSDFEEMYKYLDTDPEAWTVRIREKGTGPGLPSFRRDV